MSAPPSSQEHLAIVREFEHRTNELAADEILPIAEGWLVRSPSRPEIWMLNHVRVARHVTHEQAAALCSVHLPGLRYDHLFVEEEAGGAALAEHFGRNGWRVEVNLYSVLTAEPDRAVRTDAVIEAGEDEALALMARWIGEDETSEFSPEGLGQLVEMTRHLWRARKAIRLGTRGPDGRLTAMTMLFSDGRVAQVEDVYVTPEARGRGYGRALVTRAMELAAQGGHELTFIVADDQGWPKQLYRRLGFEPVGRGWMFHRDRERLIP